MAGTARGLELDSPPMSTRPPVQFWNVAGSGRGDVHLSGLSRLSSAGQHCNGTGVSPFTRARPRPQQSLAAGIGGPEKTVARILSERLT